MRTRLGWIGAAVLIVVYGAFAVDQGVAELGFLTGAGPEGKHRAAPAAFVIHAFAGTVVLLAGPLQSLRWIRGRRRVRKGVGLAYVAGVWAAAGTALVMLPGFAVTALSRAIFAAIAVLWLGVTSAGFVQAWQGHHRAKHAWMLRSYALTFFFVTFSLWAPLLAATPLPAAVSYPAALLLGAGLNLAAAEWGISRVGHREAGALVD
ncbi:MAG: DUF2306 domain-containing protein [Gemmatimonadales bacterium]